MKIALMLAAQTALTITLGACDGGTVKGVAARGAELHKICLECHGTELYARPDRKVRSGDALRKELLRWGDYYNPALTEQDIDDLYVYLNTEFYKF